MKPNNSDMVFNIGRIVLLKVIATDDQVLPIESIKISDDWKDVVYEACKNELRMHTALNLVSPQRYEEYLKKIADFIDY